MIEFFIVNDDGTLLRIARTLADQLRNGEARLPQYAGSRIRCAEVLMEADEAGVPQSINRVVPYYLTFDDDGYEDVQASIDAAGYIWSKSWEESEESEVVNLQKQKERREKEKLHRWTISPKDMKTLTDAALGHPRAIKNVKSVKAPPPKKVNSRAAEAALDKMSEPIWKLGFAMDNLNEDDLGVLAELIEHKAKGDNPMAPVWNGLREVCLRDREIKRLYRTSEGEWWAEVEMMKWTEPHVSESVHYWEEKCETRAAANERAREIALANSHLIESDMSIEVRVYADLEHQHQLS
jgi:hypothetical protein